MTVEEHLYLFGKMGGLFVDSPSRGYGTLATAVKGIMVDFELDEVKDTYASLLSSGVRRKLELAIAILINPHILLLESITDYLDSWSRSRVYSILQRSFKNRTALVTTSDTRDAEVLRSLPFSPLLSLFSHLSNLIFGLVNRSYVLVLHYSTPAPLSRVETRIA